MQAKIDKLIEEKLPRSTEKRQKICELFGTLSEEDKKKLFDAIDDKFSSIFDEKKIFLPKPIFGVFVVWIVALLICCAGFFFSSILKVGGYFYIIALIVFVCAPLAIYGARNDNLDSLKGYIQQHFNKNIL